MNVKNLHQVVEDCLRVEYESIERVIPMAKSQVAQAALSITESTGNLVVTGVGKSSLVGQKISASFRSIGVSAVFLNSHEMFHGDSGFLKNQDILLAISNSGKTLEFIAAIDFAKNAGCKVISIVGNSHFPRASRTDHIIEAPVAREAHKDNFLPTASTTLALALGDSLVVSVAELKKFSQEDFSYFHASGSLGLETTHNVADVMVPKANAPTVLVGDSIRKVAEALTAQPHGIAIVENNDRSFFGIVTDGDIRRALLGSLDPDGTVAEQISTEDPLVLSPQASIREAIAILENKKPHAVYSAPVLKDSQVVGIVTLHLLVQIGN